MYTLQAMLNQMTNTTIQKYINIFAAALVSVVGFSFVTTTAFADDPICYGQYGVQIECPVVTKSISVEKLVRKSNTADAFVEIVNVNDGAEVEFKISVTNTGEATLNEVKLIDILPSNLVTTGASEFILNDFKPGQVREFTLLATTNTNGMAEGESKCVVNVANIVYQSEKKASDTAQVCVKKGSVLATKLPATASSTNTTVALFIIAILSGAVIFNSTHIVEKSRRNQR